MSSLRAGKNAMPDKELDFRLIAMIDGQERFDRCAVERGLDSADAHTAVKALRVLAADYDPGPVATVLKLFLTGPPQVWPMAEQALRQDPLFLFEPRFPRSETDYDRSRGQVARRHIESFFLHERVRRLSALVRDAVCGAEAEVTDRLARLPGVENLFLERIFRRAGPTALQGLRQKISCNRATAYPPQLSLIPSYSCNLKCEYCFARSMITEHGADMDQAFFERMLDAVAAPAKVNLINFLGGEPTQFQELEAFAAAAAARGMDHYLATNGLADRERFARLCDAPGLVSVTFHVEKDDFYTPAQLALLLDNVRAAAGRRFHVAIRYNLTESDRNDWSFMQKYFAALPTFSFSFAVVFPEIGRRDKAAAFMQLRAFREKILRLLRYVHGFRDGKMIKIAWSKPFPLCYFSEPELQEVLKLSTVKTVCEIQRNNFSNNLCVTPSGYAIPCMALDAPRYRIAGLDSHAALSRESEKKVSPLIARGFREHCDGCILYPMGCCQAGCFAYVG
jgi:sulfatase maturation enzyme AslB (radical SAM superfamily)